MLRIKRSRRATAILLALQCASAFGRLWPSAEIRIVNFSRQAPDDTTTERRQPESNKVKATELPRQQESQRNRFGQRSGHGFLAYSR